MKERKPKDKPAPGEKKGKRKENNKKKDDGKWESEKQKQVSNTALWNNIRLRDDRGGNGNLKRTGRESAI